MSRKFRSGCQGCFSVRMTVSNDMNVQQNISGVFPHLSTMGDAVPIRNEAGIGAMMPWAECLWFVTYVSHTGSGTGLYSIDQHMRLTRHPQSVAGTYANRLIHSSSDQLLIGPHIISHTGAVRTVEGLVKHRLAAVTEHIEEPERKVHYLTMEGLFLELDLESLRVRTLFDLAHELAITKKEQIDYEQHPELAPQGRAREETPQPHFKAAHCANGRVYVTNNTFGENDFIGLHRGGRLAEWDGAEWKIIERRPFNEVTGRKNWGENVYATGWDRASAILMVRVNGAWQRYRMPKGSHNFEHFWQTEWPRIREVESERYLMDASGIFYELSPVAFDNTIWGVNPISRHIRIIPDFCTYKGMLVLGGNQQTPIFDTNLTVGYPESNMWFGKTDDLWGWGKPAGWGGVWWKEQVASEEVSDPYLMTGFDRKVLHLAHNATRTVEFRVEVDFLGTKEWKQYQTYAVAATGYVHHEFPRAFSAHWVRIIAGAKCEATAYFTYT